MMVVASCNLAVSYLLRCIYRKPMEYHKSFICWDSIEGNSIEGKMYTHK